MSWLVTPSGATLFRPLGLAASMKLLRLVGFIAQSLDERDGRPANNGRIAGLLDQFVSNPAAGDGLLKAAIGAIGSNEEEVAALWSKFRQAFGGEAGKTLEVLGHRFKQLGGEQYRSSREIRWKVLSADIDDTQAISPKAQLSLGAMGQAFLEIQALAALPKSPVVVPAADGKAVLRLGLEGQLSVEGKLGFSAGAASGRFSGAAQGKTKADFYFLQEPTDFFGLATGKRFDYLLHKAADGPASIFEVKDLSALLNGTDLLCLQLTADTTLSFGGEIGLAQTFGANGVTVKAGITAGFSAKEEGSFDYIFAANPGGDEPVISIHIRRKQDSKRSRSVSFGVELDPGDAAQKLQGIIDGQLGDAAAVLDRFREILPGSTDLRNLLKGLIDRQLADSPFKDDLKTLVGLDGKGEEVLRNRIIGVIETAAESWSDHTDLVASAIAREVADGLRWLNPYLPNLQSDIEKAVKAALDARIDAFEQLVAKRLTEANGYKQLAESLNAVGVKVSTALTAKQAQIDEITRGTRELLDRLQGTISRMRGQLAAAAEKKLSLRLSAERKRLEQEGLELRFDLYPNRPGAQDALNAILTGEMGAVIKLVRQYRNIPDQAPIVGLAGGYDVYEAISDAKKGELVVFGLNFESASIISADVRWAVDVDGNVCATSTAEFQKVAEWRQRRQIVVVGETNENLFAPRKNSINFGTTVSNEDEELTAEDIEDFLQGLVTIKRLSASSIDIAKEALAEQGNKRATKGRLDVGLTYTPQQLQNWLDRVPSKRATPIIISKNVADRLPVNVPVDEPGCAWTLQTVSEAVAYVMEALPSDKAELRRLQALVKEFGFPGGLAGGIRAMTPAKAQDCVGQVRDDYQFVKPRDIWLLEYRRHGAMVLYEIATLMKALWETGNGLPVDLGPNPTPVPHWTRNQLQDQQYRIAQLMSVWWLWSGAGDALMPIISSRMRTLTVALLESLLQLAKGADGSTPALWVTLSLPDANGNLVPKPLTTRVSSPGEVPR